MKIVLQRVKAASVEIDGKIYSQINEGYCLLLGIAEGDTEADSSKLIEKILKVKLFSKSDRFESDIKEIEGEILIVSQFTLYGSLDKGTKPSFTYAMKPERAKIVYEKFVSLLKENYNSEKIKTGEFGAYMKVNIQNDGPVTFILDSRD